MAEKSNSGLWIVRKGEAQWLAWREWLRREMNRQFWPDIATVPDEWPPETVQKAADVGAHFTLMRKEAAKDKDAKGIHFKPVPDVLQPWLRWSERECAQRVAEFHRSENPPELPRRTDAEVDALLAGVGMRSSRFGKLRLGPETQTAKREPTEAEKQELAERESALKSERQKLLADKLPQARTERE